MYAVFVALPKVFVVVLFVVCFQFHLPIRGRFMWTDETIYLSWTDETIYLSRAISVGVLTTCGRTHYVWAYILSVGVHTKRGCDRLRCHRLLVVVLRKY